MQREQRSGILNNDAQARASTQTKEQIIMGVYDKADGLKPGSKSKRPPLPVGGLYEKIMLGKSETFQGKGENRNKRYHKIDFQVIEGPDGCEPGTLGTAFYTIEGNEFESYDLDELANLKQAVGAAFGYDAEGTQEKVGGKVLAGTVAGDGMGIAGHVVSAFVTLEGSNNQFQKFDWRRKLTPAGTVEIIPQAAGGKPASAPAPVAPPPVAPPPPPPVTTEAPLPAGFAVHPSNPAWIYELANPSNQRPR